MSETVYQTAQAGNARFYIQFGGQGAPWYKELKSFYDDSNFKKFFDAALGAIDEERPNAEGTVGLPHGIDARGWLDDESKIPSEEYLGCAAVSIPMIQAAQLAHFENLVVKGFERKNFAEFSLGATGHSQGVIPAALLSMGLEGDDYYEGVRKFMKYLLYLGVSAQKAFPEFDPTEDEVKESEELGGKTPTPMVAVLGLSHDEVQKMVDEVNGGLDSDKQIYISLYNSPSNRILSSHRSSLIAFHRKYKERIDNKEFKFVYLRTTCPFHSALMEPVRQHFEPEIKRIGFDYEGDQLKLPVWSFFDQQNMQQEGESLPIKMYVDMAIHPLYWSKAMAPVEENDKITHILDFGPGKTSQRLSTDTLAEMSRQVPVLGAAIPKDLKTIV